MSILLVWSLTLPFLAEACVTLVSSVIKVRAPLFTFILYLLDIRFHSWEGCYPPASHLSPSIYIKFKTLLCEPASPAFEPQMEKDGRSCTNLFFSRFFSEFLSVLSFKLFLSLIWAGSGSHDHGQQLEDVVIFQRRLLVSCVHQ